MASMAPTNGDSEDPTKSKGKKEDVSSANAVTADPGLKPTPAFGRHLQKSPSFHDGTLRDIMVTVEVGNDPKVEAFTIHKDLLCHFSPNSRAALDGNFRETLEGKLTFSDVTPKSFRLFLDWLYSGALPSWPSHDIRGSHLPVEPIHVDEGETLKADEIEHYYQEQPESEALELLIFADQYDLRLLRNDCIDAIISMNPSHQG
ncbi:uncharacterized protein K452DRAFT_20116 [Aplosporella prunicola CBS 121167]|uniref:BTB domain-containing protein n=1 Tax=Aplosporella prunicola CBS 121167 TaxID=1176127 RepID=A0A6A6BED0_9PEZI|nr:uncharacterized protein K452DRAFT_20116 [Aplosporella prunicola CBS 121167]KAF2142519.1 hypothetical protein K452DRAFT_20116 [Aplosporella prunicola CBS 121167]